MSAAIPPISWLFPLPNGIAIGRIGGGPIGDPLRGTDDAEKTGVGMTGNGSVRSPGGVGSDSGFGGLTLGGVMYTGGSTVGNGSIRSHGGIDPGSDLGGFSIGLTIGCGSTLSPGDVTIGVLFRTDRTSCTRFSELPSTLGVGNRPIPNFTSSLGIFILGGDTIGCGSLRSPPSFLVGIRSGVGGLTLRGIYHLGGPSFIISLRSPPSFLVGIRSGVGGCGVLGGDGNITPPGPIRSIDGGLTISCGSTLSPGGVGSGVDIVVFSFLGGNTIGCGSGSGRLKSGVPCT